MAKTKKLPYPQNLFRDIVGKEIPYEITDERVARLWDAINDIGVRSPSIPDIFKRYYIEGESLAVIAEDLDLSGERIRQIKQKGLRMLRHPRRYETFMPPFISLEEAEEWYEARLKELEDYKNELNRIIGKYRDPEPGSRVLEDMDLSVRAYNILHRNGFETAQDIKNALDEDPKIIRNLRHMGYKSYMEIVAKIGELFTEEEIDI